LVIPPKEFKFHCGLEGSIPSTFNLSFWPSGFKEFFFWFKGEGIVFFLSPFGLQFLENFSFDSGVKESYFFSPFGLQVLENFSFDSGVEESYFFSGDIHEDLKN